MLGRVQQTFLHRYRTWIVYGLVAMVIVGPLLVRGYVLTLDMVFTPKVVLPPLSQSSYLFYVVLKLLSFVLPTQIIQKCLLFGILLLSGVGMHHLGRLLLPAKNRHWAALYAGGILYMINPFTYSRFMAGQFAVLLGYCLLPWFVHLLYRFGQTASRSIAIKLGLLTALIAVVSIHTVGELGLLVLAAAVVGGWRYRQTPGRLQSGLCFGLWGAGTFLLLSSYWLLPLLLGKGTTVATVRQFGGQDTQAFATVGGGLLLRVTNILHLQGFWLEARRMYTLPQDVVPLWGLVSMAMLLLMGYGVVCMWRTRPQLARFFLATMVVAIALAAGGLNLFTRVLPLASGYREPQKFVGLVALCYGVFMMFSAQALLQKAQKRGKWLAGLAGAGLLLLPFLFTPTMLWGCNNQLRPVDYPASWYEVNRQMRADPDNFAVLFLPWHQYMSFGFSDRIIASPAPNFFDKPVLTSNDPEFNGASSGAANPQTSAITALLSKGAKDELLIDQLAKLDVKYIIVAKELDYRDYDYLAHQPDLELVHTSDTLLLYRNKAWRP